MPNSEDVPFNPFYIGPHPSKACAAPEPPVQQCSPDCKDAQEDLAKQASASASAPPAVPSAAPSCGQAGGLLIVGMVGPTGGVATIFSTTEAKEAAAKGSSQDNPCPGKKMIECMQVSEKSGCEQSSGH
ncbi:hypothetical protein KR032_005141 [Drosophila birchii]|nr:hypothetical protein KR032_005141 [Drosophila birchii]